MAVYRLSLLLTLLSQDDSRTNSAAVYYYDDSSTASSQQHHQRRRRLRNDDGDDNVDFSDYSCEDLYKYNDDFTAQEKCSFARTCNGGDGIFAPYVFCSSDSSSSIVSWNNNMMTVPALLLLLLLLLIVLFRILGSTAEEFFSPGLEMLSLKLHFPERFAGVTLLSLGNGAVRTE